MNAFEMRLQMIKMAIDHVGGDETPKRPKQPTIKDILKLASQYNDFVSDNGLNSRPSL